MGRKRGSGLIVALGLLLGQISTWALVGVSLPGCEPGACYNGAVGCDTPVRCEGDSDCQPDQHCGDPDGGVCVAGPPSNPPATPPSTLPGNAFDLIRCYVIPPQGTIPTHVQMHAVVYGGSPPYHIRWDLGESGAVMTDDLDVYDVEIKRPLRKVSATVTDSGTPPRTGSCQFHVDFDPPPLKVGCSAIPTSGRAPLDVLFTADPRGCIGPCTFTWDFNDGSDLVPRAKNQVTHTYSGAGDYSARVTLTDAVTGDRLYPQREDVCSTVITVSGPPTPPGSPSPPPGGNHAPYAASITAGAPVYMCPAQATSAITCLVIDPDVGDSVTVTPSANPAGGNFTPPAATVSGNSGIAVFTFTVSPSFQIYTITCTPVDQQGLAGQPLSTNVTFTPCP